MRHIGATGRDRRGYGEAPVDRDRQEAFAGAGGTRFSIATEPTIGTVREGVAAFREGGCDFVIAIGGGSAIDAGKAIAAAAANSGDLLDYLEVIGKGQALESPPFPFIAVPTTAGTGSEVTRNAVLGSPEHGVKVSLRSPLMLAARGDCRSRTDLWASSRHHRQYGASDALTQLIEPYVSSRANPFTELPALCLWMGIRRASESLPRAYQNGSDASARTGMAYASLLGGLALANAGLGVVHGFAAPIGGMFDAPHGAVCAALLPGGYEREYRRVARACATKRRAGTVPRNRADSYEGPWSHAGRRSGMGPKSHDRAFDSFPNQLWNSREGCRGAGRKSRPVEQYEGKSDHAYPGGTGGSDRDLSVA